MRTDEVPIYDHAALDIFDDAPQSVRLPTGVRHPLVECFAQTRADYNRLLKQYEPQIIHGGEYVDFVDDDVDRHGYETRWFRYLDQGCEFVVHWADRSYASASP